MAVVGMAAVGRPLQLSGLLGKELKFAYNGMNYDAKFFFV